MSMSKKDYEVIGAIVRSHYNVAERLPLTARDDAIDLLDDLTDSMALSFKRDNVRFQADRFKEAATPEWHREARGLPPVPRRSPSRVGSIRPKPEGF